MKSSDIKIGKKVFRCDPVMNIPCECVIAKTDEIDKDVVTVRVIEEGHVFHQQTFIALLETHTNCNAYNTIYTTREACKTAIKAADEAYKQSCLAQISSIADLIDFCLTNITCGEDADIIAKQVVIEKAKEFGINIKTDI